MNKILQYHYGNKASITPNQETPPDTKNLIPSTASSIPAQNTSYNNQPLLESQKLEEEQMQKWVEQYNSPKDSIRLTSERFPKNYKLSKELAIPLAAIIQPYFSNFVHYNQYHQIFLKIICF